MTQENGNLEVRKLVFDVVTVRLPATVLLFMRKAPSFFVCIQVCLS